LGGSDGLARHAPATLPQLIERQVRAAATEILERDAGDFKARLNEREIRRAARLIGELCELERGRAPFVVEAVELERHVALPGGTLDLRLDRVDRLEDGSRVILDYKSGRGGTQRWFDEPVSHPQLLAYLLAVDGDIAALATAHVARSGAEFRGVAVRSGLLPKVGARAEPDGAFAHDWERQVLAWRTIATRLIERFVSGDAAVAPIEGACDHCHLHALCRIADDPRDE
jgi:RecB family exonuclease